MSTDGARRTCFEKEYWNARPPRADSLRDTYPILGPNAFSPLVWASAEGAVHREAAAMIMPAAVLLMWVRFMIVMNAETRSVPPDVVTRPPPLWFALRLHKDTKKRLIF